MQNLMAIAVFPDIAPNNLDRFKQVAEEMLASVLELECVLLYEMFFTYDNRSCVVLEEYESAAGVIEHVQRNAKALEELSALGGQIQGSMFPLSNDGPEMALIRDTWDSKMHTYFNGKRSRT
jgi:quinol monooxygenase YgiN